MSLPNTHFGAEYISRLAEGKKNIFFAGIGGVSMCSLAHISHLRGHRVSGYDRTPSKSTASLESEGITVYYEGSAEHMKDVDFLVYTVAIPADTPEYAYAMENNIPCISRADYLGYLMSTYEKRIGVSGMHGKSTTTSMLAHIFTHGGYDPTVNCGAVMTNIGQAYRVGGQERFIFEACEYMDSFLDFYPTTAIILNIEMDHVDFFKSMEQIETSFGKFADRCGEDGICVVNADDENVMHAVKDFRGKTVTFSLLDENADYYGANVEYINARAAFDVFCHGEKLLRISLAVPGKHLACDSLAAFAAAHENGASPEEIKNALECFAGASRRMELCGKTAMGAEVFSDYAHHPTELAATLATASQMGYRRFFCVFQPHTYSRTAALFEDFAAALAGGGAYEVVLADIYSAREKDTLGTSSSLLSHKIKEKGTRVTYIPDFGDMADYLLKKCGEGDMILITGAGDIDALVRLLVR